MAVISCRSVSASYSDNVALKKLSLDINQGELWAIVGPNGAGKSTLLKCLLGFKEIDEGEVRFFDRPRREVLQRIAYVPQQGQVNWQFPITVKEVVLMGRYRHFKWFKRITQQDQEKAKQALARLGLQDLDQRQISCLSGGQKQRVFLARALCQDADLYLLDEPLAGVDIKSEEMMMQECKELAKNGKTVVCVHHDLHSLPRYFDHVAFVNRQLIAAGSLQEVLTEENIEKCYHEVEV